MAFNENYLYESVTEYDISESKKYDMKFGGAKQLILTGYSGKKLHIRLASDTLSTLESDFKVKIDDTRKRLDVDVVRKNEVTEATAKEAVVIFVQIPTQYVGKVECAVNAEAVEIHSLECDSIEFDTKTSNVLLEDVSGTVEINCNLDMNILCRSLKGAVEINQVSATSKICIPEGTQFSAITKGSNTKISYEKDGKPADAFDVAGSENKIELNGMNSELVICTQ